jgi:hypothetical protein
MSKANWSCRPISSGLLGFEGFTPYRSGRSPDWIRLKNPKAPAVKREAEEDRRK